MPVKRVQLTEAQFRWESNEDAMATESWLGIRQFARDQEKLEALLAAKL
jgi:transaldolase